MPKPIKDDERRRRQAQTSGAAQSAPADHTRGGLSAGAAAVTASRRQMDAARQLYDAYRRESRDRMAAGQQTVRPRGAEDAYRQYVSQMRAKRDAGTMTRNEAALWNATRRWEQRDAEKEAAAYTGAAANSAAAGASSVDLARKMARGGGFGSGGFGGGRNRQFNALEYAGQLGENLLEGFASAPAATGAFLEDTAARAAGALIGKDLLPAARKYGLFNSLYHGNETLGLAGIENEQAGTAERMARNVEGIRTGSENADKALRWTAQKGGEVAYGVGNALPMAAEAMIAAPAAVAKGVASSADDLARMGAGVVEKSGVLERLPAQIRQLLRSRQYWTSFASEVGSDYMDALNKGATEDEAAAYALATSGINSVIEIGGGIQNAGADPLWKSALEEGREEMDQGVVQRWLEKLMLRNENPVFSLTDENAVINPVTSAREGLMGAAVGGLLSGGQMATASAMESAAARAAERAARRQTDGEATHTPEQLHVMEAFEQSVDDGLLNWVKKVKSALSGGDKSAQKMRYVIGDVKENTANAIMNASGVDVEGFSHMIDGSAVRHEEKRHGESGAHDQTMANDENLARVSYVLDNLDECSLLRDNAGNPVVSRQYRDKNNRPAPMVRISKRVDGQYYVVEAVPDSTDKKLHIVSAYMQKNSGDVTQELDMKNNVSPQLTPEAHLGPVASADIRVAQRDGEVKYGNAGRILYDTARQMAPQLSEEGFRARFDLAYSVGQQTAGAGAEQGLNMAVEHLADSGLPGPAIEAAFCAGREDANYENEQGAAPHQSPGATASPQGEAFGSTKANGAQTAPEMTEEGAGSYGTEDQEAGVRVRDGSQRNDGADPGGPTGTVAEGAGGAEVRQARGAAADSGASAVAYGKEVKTSAQLLGDGRGSGTDRLRMVTGNLSADMQAARRMGDERGLTVHLFAGGDLSVIRNGRTVKARGYIQGKAVFVRADDPNFTAEQIMRHETGHDMIDENEIDVEEVRERLHRKFTDDELDAVAQKYAQLYEGSGLTDEEIWEEIICDSLGDMNVFQGTRTAQGAPVAAVLESAKEEAQESRKADRGPPNGQKKAAPGEGRMSRANRDGSLRTLEERVQGDELLDAQDLIDEVRSVGGEVDENGYITLYHRTSAENAARIRETGYMTGKEDGLFFSTVELGQNEGYGNTAVKFSIPAELLTLDDIFTDEAHLRLPMDKPGKMYVGKYLVKETSHRYTYASLAAKKDMSVTTVDDAVTYDNLKIGRESVVSEAIKNARKFGRVDEKGNVYVRVKDTGTEVLMSKNGLRHGLDRRFSTNAPATIKAGEILSNAIRVNELYPDKANMDDGYVLIGAAKNKNNEPSIVRFVVDRYSNEVLSVDVLDAMNTKKEPGALLPEITEKTATLTGSTISIASLLDYVNKYFPDVLSMDVQRHFGRETRPAGKVGSYAKFSQATDSLEALRQENRELAEKVKSLDKELRKREQQLSSARESRDNWRNKATFSPERVGREIIRAYDGTVAESEIHDAVKAMIDHAAQKSGISFEQMKDMAMPVAQKIVSTAEAAVNGEAAQTWADIKKYHRETKLKLTGEVLADFREEPDFRYDFRKNYGRPLNLNNKGEGLAIDVAYAEMGERFGYDLYPESVTHPADQLRRMAEVLESLRPVMENPYSLNMAMATEHCANELVDKVMGEVARGYKATYAGRLEEQLYQTRRTARDMVLRERQRGEDAVKELKKHWAEQQRSRGEKRMESEERDRLLKIARRMENKKLPAVQRKLIEQYIGDLDTVSRSLTGRTLGDLNWLEHWYSEQKADPNFIPDAATEERIRRLYKKHVDDLSREEVLDLTYTLLNIENEIRTKNQLIESRERRDVFTAGLQVMQDVENAPGSKASGVRSAIDRLIVTETLSPVRQARRMAGYAEGDPLVTAVNELADGQRAQFDYERRALERFKTFVEDKAFVKEITGKHAREISIQGIGAEGPTEVQITPAMRISLYLHSLNPQNLTHIAGGGIRVPDMKLYKKGKLQEAYARGTVIRLTPSQVKSITAHMSAKEMRFAQAARDYFNTTSKESINAVSEKLKGYSIAGVENYFPINTDDSFTRKDFESIKFDGSIEGMGFLKERVKSAAPMYLRDLNSVLTQAIGMHAKYVGLAIPVRNFNKLWGVTAANVTEDGDMGASSSVQSTVRKQWGEHARAYMEKMMRDLQTGGMEQSAWDREMAKVRSSYAGAVLTLNASVAMKQAASYPTAAAVVGWGPLVKAFKSFGKVDLDLIAAYTPLQWYRSQGFSTQELGDMAKRGIRLPPALNWVQSADLLTTRKLWKAAEIYVTDHFRGLERGTAAEIREGKSAYYRKVAEIYDRIIEETQPNYTTMQRPQLLRSDSTLLQNLQMFKTQPFQNFNILYDALGNLQAKERAWKNTQSAESKAALREAKRNAAWAVTSQAAQLAVFAGMTLLWNAFRGKKDKYADEDGDVTALSTLRGVGLDMVGGLFSEVPFGGDVWELGSSVVGGGKYYGIDDVTASAISDAAGAIQKAGKVIAEVVSSVTNNEPSNWNSVRLKMDTVADSLSKMFTIAGLPLPYENVLNLGKAIYRIGARKLKGNYMGQYMYLQLTTDPEGIYKADYYDLLFEALQKDRTAHAELYRQMVEDGWEPKDIKSAMEKRMKKAEGVGSVKDLKERYTAP